MKTANKAIAIAVFAALAAACNSQAESDVHGSRHYRAAMDDFSAGRIDAAIKGFEKALRAEPGDTRARFQLACLLQDSRKDYLGAYCNYREYLFVAPDSDKAKMAKERMTICERLMAADLAKKLNLVENTASAEEIKRLEDENSQLKITRDKAEEFAQSTHELYLKLKDENARLKTLLASMEGGKEEPTKETKVIASTTDLLDVEEPDATDNASPLDEAKALNALAEKEEADTGTASTLLPQQSADAKTKKKAAETAEKKAKAAREAAKNAIPDTYVVQDGDTLYKIAIRFYGRTSAWKAIREANKDTISTDGRIRAGLMIKLPK